MCRRLSTLLVILTASLATMACGRGPTLPVKATSGQDIVLRPGAKPVPPLALDTPPAPPPLLDGKDLRTIPEALLRQLAGVAETQHDYPHAAILQYWLVERTKSGRYDLACFLARTGKADPAFYWLQLAALTEGVDIDHASRDEDLALLHADPRWNEVQAYLTACNRYFEDHAPPRTVLILPKGYQKGAPITAVVWLHGLGSTPDGFVNEGCQGYADALNVAIIGVSGTLARGPNTFVWAVNADRDAKRVRDALAEVSNRVTIKPGHIIAIGFSQGAQVGLEIAVRNPEEYAGAIALSPGAASHLQDVQPSPLLSHRGFVVACGARELPGNVQLTMQDADWLRGAKAPVREKEYPGIAAHALPPDFPARFPEWVKFIEQTRGD